VPAPSGLLFLGLGAAGVLGGRKLVAKLEKSGDKKKG